MVAIKLIFYLMSDSEQTFDKGFKISGSSQKFADFSDLWLG